MSLREFHERGFVDTSEDQENLASHDPDSSQSMHSDEWSHVNRKPDNVLECKYCFHGFSGGVTRIRSHLSKMPGGGIKVCTKVPVDIMQRMRQRTKTVVAKKKAVEERKKSMSSMVPTPFTSTCTNISELHLPWQCIDSF